MTTTMNLTTANTDYWTQTAQSVVFPCDNDNDDQDYDAACDEVVALTMKWSEHRFGLCCECECGLDDEADFIITGNANDDDTVLMCYTCFGGTATRRRELRSMDQ